MFRCRRGWCSSAPRTARGPGCAVVSGPPRPGVADQHPADGADPDVLTRGAVDAGDGQPARERGVPAVAVAGAKDVRQGRCPAGTAGAGPRAGPPRRAESGRSIRPAAGPQPGKGRGRLPVAPNRPNLPPQALPRQGAALTLSTCAIRVIPRPAARQSPTVGSRSPPAAPPTGTAGRPARQPPRPHRRGRAGRPARRSRRTAGQPGRSRREDRSARCPPGAQVLEGVPGSPLVRPNRSPNGR